MKRYIQGDRASKCKAKVGAYRRIEGQEEIDIEATVALLLEVSRLGEAVSEGPQTPAPDWVS